MLDADLGPELESTVDELVRTGKFRTKDEVLREGVRLVQAREAMQLVDEQIAQGLAEADAGLTIPAEDVFAELNARYRSRF